MKATTAAILRAKLNLKRLDPRRFFCVDDGAYTWIGDRADLTAADARALRAINRVGTRPDLATAAEHAAAQAADYSGICHRVPCIAASCSSGHTVKWEDLPESWRDGSALGDIAPQ
jgi:hypothetical protein